VIKANTPAKHPEVYPDVLNIVKENACDKMSDYSTEIIIGHVAAKLGFQNQGVCLQVLPSLLSPCSILIFAHAPLFPQPKHPSHLSLIFLPSKTPQKHLLPWLVVSRLFQTLLSTSSILPRVVRRSQQN